MNIYKARPKDLTGLLDLMQKQFIEHEIEFDHDQLETAIIHLLIHEELGFALVAKDGDQVVGVAVIPFAWTLEHGGKSAWLDELYVLSGYRNSGIGMLLIERMMKEAKKAGCLAVDLEVAEEHRRAEALYKRMGFEKLARSRWVRRV